MENKSVNTQELRDKDLFRFPYKPYAIQQQLMDSVYKVLEKGEIGFFESPTGTGKTLSLLCSALAWLHHSSKLPDDFRREEKKTISNPFGKQTKVPSWLMDTTDEDVELKEKHENLDFQLRKLKERLQQYQIKKSQPWLQSTSSSEPLSKRQKINEEEDILFDTPIIDIIPQEEPPIHITKIYYCSRTHTQLAQVHSEFIKSAWSKDIHCTILGGRKLYCINQTVNRLPTDSQLNDKCLYLQRNNSRGKSGCPYHHHQNEECLQNEILLHNLNIEDLYKESQDLHACSYYACRATIPYLELILLPYNLILNKASREALGIDLHNQVVIFDEGHNIVSSILDIYSPKITIEMINHSIQQLQSYYDRYKDRLASQSHSYIIHLLFILKQFVSILTVPRVSTISTPTPTPTLTSTPASTSTSTPTSTPTPTPAPASTPTPTPTPPSTQVFSTDRFLQVLQLGGINLFDIVHFIQSKRIMYKLNLFVDSSNPQENETSASYFQHILSFITLLTSKKEDSRIIVHIDTSSSSYLQFLFLNPATYFNDILNECRSVLIAGGTLQPFDELKTQLTLQNETPHSIKTFAYSHVLDPSHIGCIFCRKTEEGNDLLFDYSHRDNHGLLTDLATKLLILCECVPDGMVVFFPSFAFLQSFLRFLHVKQFYSSMNNLKQIFVENQEKDVFAAYTKHVKQEKKGGLLFAVVGGKLSEGINFSDELGRSIVMVGLPFPNKTDVVLQEKMKYLEQQQIGLGKEFYQNLCIKAVNQAIGRAFRHKEDWAVVVFMDIRYSRQEIRSGLTQWIEKQGCFCDSNIVLKQSLSSFFSRFWIVCFNKTRYEKSISFFHAGQTASNSFVSSRRFSNIG